MQFFISMLVVLGGLLFSADEAPKADPAAVEWLDRLEARGRELKTFQATVKYEKGDQLLDPEVRTGTVVFVAGEGEGKASRFAVLFRQLLVDGGVVEQKREFIFDGAWLVEKDHNPRRKSFVKRQVVPPGQENKLDPTSLDGPFPLPLGQKRDKVLARFDVKAVEDQPGEGPANSVHLRLTPRGDAAAVEGQKEFESVDLWFDRGSLLPVKVQTKERKSVTTVTFSNIKENAADPTKLAELMDMAPPEEEGWRVEIKPWKE